MLERTRIGSLSHPPHDLDGYKPPSEHALPCASSSSRVTARTKAQYRKSEAAIAPPSASHCTGKDSTIPIHPSAPDSGHVISDVHAASLDAEGPAAPHLGTSPLSIPDKEGEHESFAAFDGLVESGSAQMRPVAQNIPMRCPPNMHVSLACDGLCHTHPVSVPSSPQLVDGSPSEPSSKEVAPEGEATRIEIAFEKFRQELLYSPNHDPLIQEVARRISTTLGWLEVYNAYKEAAGRALFCWGAGFRKNRLMDLMNLILEEAPSCGLDIPYTHQLRYGRCHYDGSEWNPESGSSQSASPDSKSPEGESMSPGEGGSSESEPNSRGPETPDSEPFRGVLPIRAVQIFLMSSLWITR